MNAGEPFKTLYESNMEQSNLVANDQKQCMKHAWQLIDRSIACIDTAEINCETECTNSAGLFAAFSHRFEFIRSLFPLSSKYIPFGFQNMNCDFIFLECYGFTEPSSIDYVIGEIIGKYDSILKGSSKVGGVEEAKWLADALCQPSQSPLIILFNGADPVAVEKSVRNNLKAVSGSSRMALHGHHVGLVRASDDTLGVWLTELREIVQIEAEAARTGRVVVCDSSDVDDSSSGSDRPAYNGRHRQLNANRHHNVNKGKNSKRVYKSGRHSHKHRKQVGGKTDKPGGRQQQRSRGPPRTVFLADRQGAAK